jgi:hypothetical protein
MFIQEGFFQEFFRPFSGCEVVDEVCLHLMPRRSSVKGIVRHDNICGSSDPRVG